MRTYWRVKCSETVGGITLEGWVRFIPAETAAGAKAKAVRFLKKKAPGSNPTAVTADQELQIPVNPVIEVVLPSDADRPLDIEKLLGLG